VSVRLLLGCNGCKAEVRGGRLNARFVGFNGADYGFGRTEFELVEIPDGWMPFDPYTYCTYCPVCSEELFGDACNQDALAEVPADFDHYLVLT
jgi:hypothetical protein